MKKIFLTFCVILSFFLWNIAFAEDNDTPWSAGAQMDAQAQENDNQWAQDTSNWQQNQTENDEDESSFWCNYSEWAWLSDFLNNCKPKSVVWNSDMTIEGGFKEILNRWIGNIALILWVMAVGALVYAALLFQFANGEDEKIKKAKDIVKWTIIGFILLISASGIIYIVINVMFWLWWWE